MPADRHATPLAFVYSGQGSQSFQMGRELYAREPVFRYHLDRLDACIADLCARPLLPLLYGVDRQRFEPFTDLLQSSLAIYAIERAATQMLLARGIRPDLVVSVSLGILAGLALGGCLSDEQAIDLIRQQSLILQQHTPPGAMLSVLAGVQLLADQQALLELTEVSGYLFGNCMVLSMPLGALAAVEALLREEQVVFQRMPVERPFHSRWIEPARSRVLELFQDLPARAPSLPIWAVDEAAELKTVNAMTMWNILRKPVRFQQSITQLERRVSCRYVDLGPSGSLSTALRYLLPDGAARSSALLPAFARADNPWLVLEAQGLL